MQTIQISTLFYQLPNGAIVTADDNKFISVLVGICLQDLIGDVEHLNDRLSEEATGSCLLQDVSYTVVGVAEDNMLRIRVSGNISLLLDSGEATPVSTPATSDYDVVVLRTGFGFHTVTVKAINDAEAEALALDTAGDHLYSEKTSDYAVVSVTQIL